MSAKLEYLLALKVLYQSCRLWNVSYKYKFELLTVYVSISISCHFVLLLYFVIRQL